jgi:molybdenum cofactor synthesis domain-containing protein
LESVVLEEEKGVGNGTLLHVCISSKKGITKHEIPCAKLLLDYGMEGDAHAGHWHRQVSLLAHTDIEFMRAKGLSLKPGAFGENLVIGGLNTNELGVGSLLRVGPVLLELTQVGKVCHTRCAIYYKTGDCIMPRTGLFARVVESGEVTAGMSVETAHRVDRSTLQAAVITVSDRCSAGQMIDTAAPAVAALLSSELGARIAWTKLVPDNISEIAEAIKDFSERRVNIILTAGGTGPDVRDVTPEATRKVLDRELPGLAEAMRAASSAKTPNAWLSRAVAGIRRDTLIVNLPGSKKAAVENLEAILSLIPHAVKILRQENVHPENDAGRVLMILK